MTLILLSARLASAQAPTYSILHSFTLQEGIDPQAGLTQGSDGNFYGATTGGGTNNLGTIFKMTPAGVVTPLYNFGPLDGSFVVSRLIQGSDGSFYGTASFGGANSNGTIFKITLDGTFTLLHTFSALQYPGPYNADGIYPSAGLVQGTDGNLYGVAARGGALDQGTIYKITPSGNFTTLYNFTGLADGSEPATTLLLGSDGTFYGTTGSGGIYNQGTIFKFTPDGAFTLLYTFSSIPVSNLGHTNWDGATGALWWQDSSGVFYGSTAGGGIFGYGTAFTMTPSGNLTKLHDFDNFTDGSGAFYIPGGDGNFYGIASGGPFIGQLQFGTIFQMTPNGRVTTIHYFTTHNGDGGFPSGLTLGADGNLYGTTFEGGSQGYGIVFVVHPGTVPPPVPGDFNQDGKSDLLFQDQASGQLAVWLMNGSNATQGERIATGQSADWQCVGIADCNQDNLPDLLFQNVSTGRLAIWYMDGFQWLNGAFVFPEQDPHWRCVSVNDFNGDGKPDLLFQNTSTGQLALWYMDAIYPSCAVFVYPAQDPTWQCVGSADFNGDGNPDLVFQNKTTGQIAIWYMYGNYQNGGTVISPAQDPTWKVVAIVDINGDGKPDLVFQNSSTGRLAVWYMNGVSVLGGAYITPEQSANWRCVGPS